MTAPAVTEVVKRAHVSVIIPCYRCADTIERAVASVMAQTLPPEEIILIDDFSNDAQETVSALNRLRQRHQEICIKVILLSENNGPGSARNAGWSASSQPYLAFLDADDSWHPRKLEIQYKWMEDHPEVLLSGHLSNVLEQGSALPELPTRVIAHQINKHKLLIKNCLPTRSVMLKREVPFKFVPGKRYAEDYMLWLTILLNGHQASLLEMPLAYSYKAEFGGGGLTGNLWKSEQGVIDTYQRLFNLGLISLVTLYLVSAFSLMKYWRRCFIVKLRLLYNSLSN